MIGANLQFRVNMSLFCDHDVTETDELMQVRENVAAMGKHIADIIYSECAITDMDTVSVDLDYIDYIEPEDIEEEVTEIYIE